MSLYFHCQLLLLLCSIIYHNVWWSNSKTCRIEHDASKRNLVEFLSHARQRKQQTKCFACYFSAAIAQSFIEVSLVNYDSLLMLTLEIIQDTQCCKIVAESQQCKIQEMKHASARRMYYYFFFIFCAQLHSSIQNYRVLSSTIVKVCSSITHYKVQSFARVKNILCQMPFS